MARTTPLPTACLVVGLLLAACAGGTSDDHGGHGGATDAGEAADASEADRTIDVTALDTMAFDPPSLEVEAGETITFSVTNSGEAIHEFTLGDAAEQAEHAEEMAGAGTEMAHDDPNTVTLAPGETAELTWRFGESGTIEYACHRPGHYEAGMRGDVTVA